MARMSIRTFLLQAKRHLHQTLHQKTPASFVLGNESADLDSITCALVYSYIHSSSLENRRANTFMIPVANIPAKDLPLRPELTALLKHVDVKPEELVTLDDLGEMPMPLERTEWVLVDWNRMGGGLGEWYSEAVGGCIDHHDDERAVSPTASPRIIEKSGSCNSLVVNHLRPMWDDLAAFSTSIGASNGSRDFGFLDDTAYASTWDAQVAKLSLASILIDTYNMQDASKVTDADKKAVRYLEARINVSPKMGKTYDREKFFAEISEAKADLSGMDLDGVLRKDYKEWSENGMKIGISSAVKPLEYLKTKASGNFTADLGHFAKERDLHLYMLMTAYTSESSRQFERECLLLILHDGKAEEAAKRFTEECREELELEEKKLDCGDAGQEVKGLWIWDQRNVKASRKRVAPLVRGCLH
ncbi:putative exopolyphosphatase [Teratosphaeria destructans]|uniref:Exopolyphosphatase n=1 Tax=Teratosphaeria destructans TaxID=418781 RepID=A0A9W7VZE9_9PEZI|nr:putative exopolyphosphatase [Teratosphaeria destructans]